MGLQRQKRRAAGFSVAVLSATLLVGGARAWAKGGQEIGAQNESATGNAPHNITLEMLDAPLTTAINVIEKKTGVQIAQAAHRASAKSTFRCVINRSTRR
jgi:hypothetical protein